MRVGISGGEELQWRVLDEVGFEAGVPRRAEQLEVAVEPGHDGGSPLHERGPQLRGSSDGLCRTEPFGGPQALRMKKRHSGEDPRVEAVGLGVL
jgi:hypothetical protein